jgi:succinylglutamic semialdehyde dehydrogenase
MTFPIVEAKHFIGGQWIEGRGPAFTRTSPSGDSVICRGNIADDHQIDAAIASAQATFPTWSETTLDDRMVLARRFADLVTARKEELARLISFEVGKPLWESRTEVTAVAGKVANSIDAILKRRWTTTEQAGAYVAVTRYRPFGAMLVLGPFNLPAHLPGAHMVPALLAGNTVVFKPSELSPAVGQWLVYAWQECGLPDGVLNLIHGAATTAIRAVENPAVAGVLFTGSHRAGISLHRAMAGKPEKVLALEMGGNNALVVHNCSDLRRAAITIIHSAFITSGQRCTCARRLIIVGKDTQSKLLSILSEMIPNIRVSDPFAEPQPFMGPVIHQAAADNLLQAQSKLIADGGISLVAMRQTNAATVTPGLLSVNGVQVDDTEHFGPLLLTRTAKDLDEAISLANDTQFGLSAGYLGDKVEDFHYFLHRIHAGVVNWNRQTTGASGRLPFGGIGASGNHFPSGYFAADYCSFPIASLESHELSEADQPMPGLDKI